MNQLPKSHFPRPSGTFEFIIFLYTISKMLAVLHVFTIWKESLWLLVSMVFERYSSIDSISKSVTERIQGIVLYFSF